MGRLTLAEALQLRDPTPEAMVVCAETLAGADSDVWDVAEVLEKIREWLRRDVGLAQKLVGGARLQTTIVAAIKRHGRNLEVARFGAGAVAGCCQRSNQNADIMLKAGILKELFCLMDTHLVDTIVQDNICVALWRLAERQGAGAEEIVRQGGLPRLFRAMEEHQRNPFVQVNSLIAFERLYAKGGAPPEGMKEAAEKAMRLHPSNMQLKRGAARLLEALQSPPQEPPPRAPKAPVRPAADPVVVVGSCAGPLQASLSRRLELPLHEWLMQLDEVGFLMEYHSELKQNFDSLAQVVDIYAPSGQLDPQFFDDLGIRKLGHRRLFEKWCRETLVPHSPDAV